MKSSEATLVIAKDRFKSLSKTDLKKKAIEKSPDFKPKAAKNRAATHFLKEAHVPRGLKANFRNVYFFDTEASSEKWKPAKVLSISPEGVVKIKFEVTKSDSKNADSLEEGKFFRTREVFYKNPLLLTASGAKYYKENPEKFLENSKPIEAKDRVPESSIVGTQADHFFRKNDVVYRYDANSGQFKKGEVILTELETKAIKDIAARALSRSNQVATPYVQLKFNDGQARLEQRSPELMRASTYDLYGFFSQASRALKGDDLNSKPSSPSERTAKYLSKNEEVMFFDYKETGRWIKGKVLSSSEGKVSIAKPRGRKEYLSFNLADQGFLSLKDWDYLAAPQTKGSLAKWLSASAIKPSKVKAPKPGDFTSSTTVIPGGVRRSQDKLKNMTLRSPMNG